MRRRVHHSVTEPRFELTPLLDVLFFLLMFFMYAMILTVRANVMPVSLPSLSTGEAPVDNDIAGITVDNQGHYFLNRKPITLDQLEPKLKEFAARPKPPAVFVALEEKSGGIDRGPIFVELIDMLRRNGINKFNVVGQEKKPTPAPTAPPAP
jgi:biopolymer transport protein ExbD